MANNFDRYKAYIKRIQEASAEWEKSPAGQATAQLQALKERIPAEQLEPALRAASGGAPLTPAEADGLAQWGAPDIKSIASLHQQSTATPFKIPFTEDELRDYQYVAKDVANDDKKSFKGMLGNVVKGLAIGGPILGGIAATGALGAAAQGFAGGAPLGGAGGTAAGSAASVAAPGIGGAEAGLGYGGYGGAGGTVAGQGGLLGGTSVASGSSALGGLGTDIATGVGSLRSAGGGLLGDAAKTVAGQVGSNSMNLTDILGLISGGAGIANSLKDPATAQMPDFMALAQQQADAQAKAAALQTQANRPNQTNAAGDTSQWVQDPVTGQWSQKQTYGESNQQLFDQTQGIKGGLLGQIGSQSPLTTEGLPQLGGDLMSAAGNSQEIQQAWMNLLNPEREMARNGEIQRLKSQGLTEDSPAFQRAMLRLDQADTDAQNKALIYGTQEYGNIYNRDLAGRSSQRADSQTMFGQNQAVHQQPFMDLQNLTGSTPGSSPQFGQFMSSTGSNAADVYGAGQDQYAALLAQANAKNAASNNTTQGLIGLGSTFWGK